VVDALAGGRQSVSVRDLAHLPRPFFAPVVVYAGRAPGYEGPVARVRPAGAPIGAATEATAYTGEKEGADASPVSQPAPDAKPLRAAAAEKHARHTQHAKVAAPEASETPPPARTHAAKAKGKVKTAALETKKPHKKTEAKAHREHAAPHPAETGKAAPKHAEKQPKGKAHAGKTGHVGGADKTGDAGGAGAGSGDAGQ
jgi:D-alanyl-D-alanine carboxypeptidase